jgi:tRNA(His) guanylyltransferase
MSKHAIMTRMKNNYESRNQTYLTRRTPVIMRIDGKAFHTYTKGLNKPFDKGLIEDMQQTAIYLCQNIQGAKCAYTQSDEISILITDYDTLTTDAWFDYNVQKMTSISASLATAKFNQLRLNRIIKEMDPENFTDGECIDYILQNKIILANFDSRVFNIPKEEVANYFLARQEDAVSNSISMLAQSLYSHNELHKKKRKRNARNVFSKRP